MSRTIDTQRTSTQKSAKDTAPSSNGTDPLDVIPEHLHRHVLGFLLAKPIPTKHPRDLEDKKRPFDMVRDDHHNHFTRFQAMESCCGRLCQPRRAAPKFSLREI